VTRDAFPIAHARRIVDAMSRAKIIVGTLMLFCGLAMVALRISITRQPNGDAYGIVLGGVEHIAFGLLLALVGGLVLATAWRG
jgi:drug/metabolite transporter (DMT)-like permease